MKGQADDQGNRMATAVRWFCRAVLTLDLIPRYGQVYRYLGRGTPSEPIFEKVGWRYERHGRWGLLTLNKLGLLGPYIDALEREQQEAE